MGYNRKKAAEYAHKWAFSRNPAYYDYEKIGGDCTNFVSQCLFAGGGVMNYSPTYGWYYIDANKKAPAWTGTVYLNNFLTRKSDIKGPRAENVKIGDVQVGDVVQLVVVGEEFHHSTIVVSVKPPFSPEDILVAAHSFDADYRPISAYNYKKARFLHIISSE